MRAAVCVRGKPWWNVLLSVYTPAQLLMSPQWNKPEYLHFCKLQKDGERPSPLEHTRFSEAPAHGSPLWDIVLLASKLHFAEKTADFPINPWISRVAQNQAWPGMPMKLAISMQPNPSFCHRKFLTGSVFVPDNFSVWNRSHFSEPPCNSSSGSLHFAAHTEISSVCNKQAQSNRPNWWQVHSTS